MNKSLNKLLLGSVFVAAAALSVNSWSMGPHGGMEFDSGHMVAHMADRLELTDEQQSQIETVLAAAKEHSAADRKRLQELKEDMHALVKNFDDGQAQAIADELGEITTRLTYQAASTHAKVYAELNETQRAEMEAFREKRQSRRGKWMQREGKSDG